MEKVGRSPRRSGPRISDVAARAGVSVATVSRVLTGSSPVAAAKREQLLRRSRNSITGRVAARSLSLGTTGVIGVVAPFFTFGATSVRLRGIMDRAAPEEYDVMIFNVESAHQRDDAFAKFARRDRLDGLIVISLPIGDADVATLRRQELPTCSWTSTIATSAPSRSTTWPVGCCDRASAQPRAHPDRLHRRCTHQPARLHVERPALSGISARARRSGSHARSRPVWRAPRRPGRGPRAPQSCGRP